MEQAAKYVYKVYLEQSITRAAERLFISQPALSAAIARHEKELGFQIFNRSTLPISLTPKGRIYIESLGQILAIEQETALQLREAAIPELQQIAIGCTNTAPYYLLPSVCKELEQKYPGIKITVDLGNNGGMTNLSQKLLEKRIDFYLCSDKPTIKCKLVRLLREPLVVAVSDQAELPEPLRCVALSHDMLVSGACSGGLASCSDFRNIPFISYYPGTSMFKKMHKILGNYKSVPVRIVNAKNSFFHCRLAKTGSGAILLPVSTAKELFTPADHMAFFYLDHPSAYQELYICSNTDAPKSSVMQDFVHICQSVCQRYTPSQPLP